MLAVGRKEEAMPDQTQTMTFPFSLTDYRASGVLLHVTSLPSPYGIGDMGPAAFAWVDRLHEAGQSWWQALPLGPTGYGDSPYQALSSFAGNGFNYLAPADASKGRTARAASRRDAQSGAVGGAEVGVRHGRAAR